MTVEVFYGVEYTTISSTFRMVLLRFVIPLSTLEMS